MLFKLVSRFWWDTARLSSGGVALVKLGARDLKVALVCFSRFGRRLAGSPFTYGAVTPQNSW